MEHSSPSIWILIHSWLTPAFFFLLINCIIGTIVLTSKMFLAHHRHDDPAAGDAHLIVRTASSALHRLRSLSLTRIRSGDFIFDPAIAAASHQNSEGITNPSPKTEVFEKEDEHLFSPIQSDTLPEAAEIGESPVRMMQSASERPLRRSFEKKKVLRKEKAVEEEVEVGVDARADDFITRFRKQLHLQRLNSLLNYREMLDRGK